jgi:serine phosphatase RsbU (regulator of sigma subunit)
MRKSEGMPARTQPETTHRDREVDAEGGPSERSSSRDLLLPRRSGWFLLAQYALALLLVGAGLGIAVVLREHVEGAVFAPLFAALALAVWLGGVGPGVLALVVALLLSRYLLLEPLYSLSVHSEDWARWSAFLVSASLVVAVGAALHRERLREAQARRAEDAARVELVALQNATAGLSSARDAAAVADAVLSYGLPAVGAACGAVLVYDAERDVLFIERAVGYPAGLLDHLQEIPLDAQVPVSVAARSRQPVLLRSLEEVEARFPAMAHVFRTVGNAGAVLPLVSGDRLVGGIVFVFAQEQAFEEPHLRSIEAFAALCGDALDRASEHEAEHHIATTLQRSLLPGALPAVEGVELAPHYLAAAGGAAGGDWYDAAFDSSGRLVVSVGDVCGKGVSAAALMGRLRIAAKAYAMEGYAPGEIVSRVDRFGATLPEFQFTTIVVASLDIASGRLGVYRAGHMPPLIVPAEGEPYLLWDGAGVPMGVGAAETLRTEAWLELQPGDSLLLYSDGLVERRDRPLDASLRDLIAAVSSPSPRKTAREIADHVVRALVGHGTHQDDVAVLALRYARD